MRYIVHPAAIHGGDLKVPGDKSISHRALMFCAIADGQSTVSGFLAGEDCLATMAALRDMGVMIEDRGGSKLVVHGCGRHGLREPSGPLDMGNSGTAMRLFAGLLAGQSFDCQLTGDDSLTKRPMGRVIAPLEAMGARITAQNGYPPLAIRGNKKLRAIDYTLPVASAQVKSAILLAGLYASGKTTVTEPAITRDHTERILGSMGVKVQSDGQTIGIEGGQALRATNIAIPADLSSAAFLILATLISGNAELLVRNVGVNPTRTGVIDLLRQMGARIDLIDQRMAGDEPVADLRVRASALHGIEVDPALVSLAIDEFPVLFVAAALAKGTTCFSGLGELRVKESDRIAAMSAGLLALGIKVQETPDGAIVEGGALGGGTVDSFGDHRIAMSFAIAGTVASSNVEVLNTAAVDTSFPGFVDCMRSVGARIEAINGARI
jgi:3-phosphoshikimate 1-carboxyvinyltransferase